MEIGPQVVFRVAGLPVTNTLLVALSISVILIIGAALISRSFKVIPGKGQAALESVVFLVMDFIDSIMPGQGRKYITFIFTILVFIFLANTCAIIPGVKNPTSDLNTTAAFGLCVFFYSHYTGIKVRGIKHYLHEYVSPMPFMLPLHIIDELAKPVSHSFRLFGNILGGAIILEIVYSSTYLRWAFPVPLHFWFDLFVGTVQSIIFSALAIVFISIKR